MTGPRHDPNRVLNQKAVQNPNRRVWLVASGLLALIAIVLFAFSVPIVAAWAWIGIAFQVAIFAALLVNGFTGRKGSYQGYLFAVLLCVQAAVALLVIVVIAIAAWMPAA
ncbi:hypothetical protein NS206_16085 [Microbacterium testaceum]|jgi:hypothetical protein|uniref:Uncharacterized protein n=1 Tax=Microbacterium testaceum TaxID=2033 RepID=A0A147FAM0_MICTE|nr:hypothetical protein [Microbacterium testaceum]KTS13555.1 hypothetical protein RSA3_04075 [Microbacterium testaceum]KTS55542.1 hypothetical protein NS206_16085 [Microbacterium testaceum]